MYILKLISKIDLYFLSKKLQEIKTTMQWITKKGKRNAKKMNVREKKDDEATALRMHSRMPAERDGRGMGQRKGQIDVTKSETSEQGRQEWHQDLK